MELVVRKNDLLRELQLFQGIVEREEHHSDPGQRAGRRRRTDNVRMLATDLEVALRSTCAAIGGEARFADAAGQEALRDRQGAAGHRRPHRRRSRAGVKVAADRFGVAHADAAEGRLPGPAGRRQRLEVLPRARCREMVSRRTSPSPGKTRATS